MTYISELLLEEYLADQRHASLLALLNEHAASGRAEQFKDRCLMFATRTTLYAYWERWFAFYLPICVKEAEALNRSRQGGELVLINAERARIKPKSKRK